MKAHRLRNLIGIFALIVLPAVSLNAGCGAMDSAALSTPGSNMGGGGNIGGGGNLGATTGGAQDFRQVRQSIESGQVPAADAFLVEGLLSEHDLPLAGDACHDLLCLQFGAGIAKTRFGADPKTPGAAAGRTVLVQVGMSSGLSAETFHRAPLNLALVVDVSGSMGSGQKMTSTRTALEHLVDRLDEGDLVSIIAFSTYANLRLPPTPGHERAKIKAAIANLRAGG
ncbi:MAG: VWA domain-containing protein, partial [Deltaproteobacteria bacterium]|nr:VWA domain-containing protein [Deltaproteobacteria bacterium]